MYLFQIRDELKLERRMAKRQRLQIPTCEMPVFDHFEEVLKLGETLTEGDQVNVSCYKINVFAR